MGLRPDGNWILVSNGQQSAVFAAPATTTSRFFPRSDFDKLGISLSAPIAQLDRALVYETRGPRFESWWARHF